METGAVSCMRFLGGAFALAMATFCGVWTLLFTHRISGPLKVMRNHLADLANGRFPHIRPLRQKDEFKDLYGAFHRVVQEWQSQRQRDLEVVDGAMSALQECCEGPGSATQEKLESVTQRLRVFRDEIAAHLATDSVPAVQTGVVSG